MNDGIDWKDVARLAAEHGICRGGCRHWRESSRSNSTPPCAAC